ncbi:NAD dependent epimerase/dehydratase family protein [Xylogone sp. PMI_703]|nr:NAD dependent epimerase/dehydratase family protein [Xylogone sp. PMI_703]
MSELRLLITGATGFIGGSVLETLLNSPHGNIKNLRFSAIVRNIEKAKQLSDRGVNLIEFSGLDDSEALTRAASQHDIVINTANGFHSESARALILGLGQRRKETGKDVYFFHTTGTSNIADKPHSKEYYEPRILTDKDDLYSYLQAREAREPYAQRTTDLVSIKTGLEVGVRTYLIMSPLIYGTGKGMKRQSVQVPTIIRTALEMGQVGVIGNGYGVWDAVHIGDVTPLYELLLAKVLAGEDIPYGPKGIFFAETEDFTWLSLAEGLAKEMYKQGALKTADVKHLTVEEASKVWTRGSLQLAELGFGSNSRSRAVLSRELGWKPTKTRGDLQKSFEVEIKMTLEEYQKN